MPTSLEHGRMVQSMIYLIQTRLLNLLIVAAWLNHMLMFAPFCLCLGDCALAPCVYMQRQRQEANKQVMEGKDTKCISKGIKQISVIDMANIGTRM